MAKLEIFSAYDQASLLLPSFSGRQQQLSKNGPFSGGNVMFANGHTDRILLLFGCWFFSAFV
jgi:hypothetical protein